MHFLKVKDGNTNTKLRGFSKQKTNDMIFYVCMIVLPCLQFIIFWIGTNLETILLAFQSYDRATDTYFFVGFDNFAKVYNMVVNSVNITQSLKNGLTYQTLNYLITWPLSILFSFYIYKKRKGSGFFRTIFFLPQLVGGVSMIVIYTYFAENLIPELWLNLTGSSIVPSGGLLSFESAVFPTIVFYHLWTAYGANILFYSSSMSQVDASLVESAQLDGATNIQELWHIVLPHLWPMMSVFLTAGIATFLTTDLGMYAFFELDAPASVRTLGYYITQNTLGGGIAEYPFCSALSLIVTFIAVPLTLLTKYLCEKFGPSED